MNEGLLDEQDRQDMLRLAGGHDAALNDLMERHGQRLFHYLMRQLSNEGDAEDCAQETFKRVYQHRARFRLGAKFSTWLYAITTNLAHDCHRRHARQPRLREPPSEDERNSAWEMIPDQGLLPDEQLQSRERSAQVRAAVQALPEELRTPLVLYEYEELAQAEIAEILQCTPKAVELRIARARHALRKTLGGLESALK
jgi:RNA polymerase sigma-70 factor (ECF subfamily)